MNILIYENIQKTTVLLTVCKKTFLSITCVGIKRLHNIVKYFFTNGCLRPEKCGGFRQNVGDKEITNSKVNFISQYKGGKSVRVYLLPELNVKLWTNWKLHRN